MTTQEELPEAAASGTVKFKSKNGYEWLFTIRKTSGSELLQAIEKLELELIAKEAQPLAQSFGAGARPQVVVPTKPCPKHNVPMKERIRKDTGEKHFSHSRGVYPNLEWCNGGGFPDEIKTVQQYEESGGNY